ncbi:TIGR02328 family protein [Natribacillus halophilus]|uniref:Pyrimidine dimer DNA glycosylase /DNA-(Apurinic or apyrimidinic site) lyase n=1 Tax=Natribacillus halophilus TaxID=549003 RepID=A0A1G8ML69_9BACI|nr:TIGR02328 family protein [Natribacillus halophilus]SDI68682.1 conserved hypothetical protein [Natribacillus halophilus]
MRLWHDDLIPFLPRQQLLGQHRECCALRGKGWDKPHSTVNYVFQYSPYRLYLYHQRVMDEMQERGYRVDELWINPLYRGKHCDRHHSLERISIKETPIYPEHNDTYLNECLENLEEKGVIITHAALNDPHTTSTYKAHNDSHRSSSLRELH